MFLLLGLFMLISRRWVGEGYGWFRVRVRVCGLVRAACLRVMPPSHETLAFVVAVEFGSSAVGPFHSGSGGRLPCLVGFVVRACMVSGIAIACKRGVAENDLYVDGNCSCPILEPIAVQDAALLQTDPSSNNFSCDCSKQVLVQYSGWKSLVTSPRLQTVVKSE